MNKHLLKINPTSADTVVSAIPALLMFNKNIKLNNGAVILFINLVIRPPFKEKTYNFYFILEQTLIRKIGYAEFAYSNSLNEFSLRLLKNIIY